VNNNAALLFLEKVLMDYSCLTLKEIEDWSTVRGTRFVEEFGNPMAELSILPHDVHEKFWQVNVAVCDHETGDEVEGNVLFYATGEVYISANYLPIRQDGTKEDPKRLFASRKSS
jgi:hypothetical protein